MDNCSIGENIKIIYTTPLKLCNIKNDKSACGKRVLSYRNVDIIVSELKDNIIENAIEDYSKEDAYWLRLYSISYGDQITTKPFFEIKVIDDEYVDSYSIMGQDDGQESLEKFIKEYL